MSNPTLSLLAGLAPPDPRAMTIIERLIDRTRAGRLTWTRTPSTYETALKNGTTVGFVASPSHLISLNPMWDQFSIRQRNGKEVLKIENSTNMFAIMPIQDPVRAKLTELFHLVTEQGKDELDSILGELDNT
jgi:hypothetical protein